MYMFQVMTQRFSRNVVMVLWAIPFAFILLLFSTLSGQGFQSRDCGGHAFLGSLPFRATYSSLILLPTIAILGIYAYFHSLLWRKRDVSKSCVSRQNIRAARTTFLIMFTCTCGWLPAVVNHLLICDNGCKYTHMDFSPNAIFALHSISYVLIILKSFTNPLIFAIRQKNIRRAVKRLIFRLTHCRDQQTLHIANKSRYSSVTRGSVHRLQRFSYKHLDGTAKS